MTVSRHQLLSQFGRAVRGRTAVVFVGAGMSMGAGLPSWDELIEPLRLEADVPPSVADAALAAEYIAAELKNSRIKEVLLEQLTRNPAEPTKAMKAIMALPVSEYWTTNYDTLLEEATQDDMGRIVADNDYRTTRDSGMRKRLTKMHGSLSLPGDGTRRWESDPVLRRADFEQYGYNHPLIWSVISAQFLTRSFLFLGLSFDDPNLNLLLRVARALPPGIAGPRHYAVLQKPADQSDARVFDLLAGDLERSGIDVFPIDSFDELDDLSGALLLQARDANIFVSGSGEGEPFEAICAALGAGLSALADSISLLSFGGSAALSISNSLKAALPEGSYDPERLRFYFRSNPNGAPIEFKERVGTAVFTEQSLESMRASVLSQVRVMLVVGGGRTTGEEAELARKEGIIVVPVAASGGTAKEIWEAESAASLQLGNEGSRDLWTALESDDIDAAARAAVEIIGQVLFGA
jgi:hypothetical protein